MIIFISGTGTGVGKTYINMRLNALLMGRGFKIVSIKPIETGIKVNSEIDSIDINYCNDNNISDALLHAQNQSVSKDISEICFYTFALPAAPFVADLYGIIDIDLLKNKIKDLESKCDILLIEGAGGLFVPIKKDYFFIDLIKDLWCGEFSCAFPNHKFLCVLVSDDKLGCIDALLSHREAIERREIEFISIVNVFNRSQFLQISYPFLCHLERNFIFQTQEHEILDFITHFINS